MNNLGRVLRLSLKYRYTIAGIIATSLLVAVLWGGNIGALYPVFEVILENKSLSEWLDDQIAEDQANLARHQQQADLLRQEQANAAGEERDRLAGEIDVVEAHKRADEAALAFKNYAKPHVDRYSPNSAFQTVVWIVALLMLATMIKNVFIVTNTLLVTRLAQLTIFDLRRQFFDHAMRLDLGTLRDERTSSLVSRFNNDINVLQVGLNALFGRAVREPLKIFACLIGAGIVNWRLLLISLVLMPVVAMLINILAASIKRANRRALEEFNRAVGLISETFNGIQTIQAYTLEKVQRAAFVKTTRELVRKYLRIALYNSLTKPTTEILGISVLATSMLFGIYLVLTHQTHVWGIKICDRPMNTPLLLVFYALMAGAVDPARKLTDVFNQIQAGLASADRLYPLLDRHPKVTDPVCPKTPPKPHRRIVFDRVNFYYDAANPVLRDVDLTIEFGETIAIVGPNGCGKTTLANLLPRFYDPVDGAVRLDDVDLRDLRLRDLRRKIGAVTQQTHLLDDTVINNIRFGSIRATDEQVIEAAKKAQAHEFITQKLDQGYETMVGQSGGRLSGGQRQRICLARAILRDPEILILDEATSQVDLESEQLLHQALQLFVRGRTSIIITHRLSMLTLADRILVMDAGRVADVGTHNELVARCELYRRLHEIQFRQSA